MTLLSVVTVVFNDSVGLQKTMASLTVLPPNDYQHIIVDGSTDSACQALTRSSAGPGRRVLVEPDGGIFDAMNKGLRLASGNYVVFMNAGDRFHPLIDIELLRVEAGGKRRVAIGYTIEEYGPDQYLNPGLGREANAFQAPQHQATFYPREFYADAFYDLSLRFGADGVLTGAAIRERGGVFLPTPVSVFALGGASSNYGDLSVIVERLRDATPRHKVLVTAKAALWRMLPRRVFYRVLAGRKYTRLAGNDPRLRRLRIMGAEVVARPLRD